MNYILEITDLKVDYKTKKQFAQDEQIVHAINGVNLGVKKGEILAIAGESGCGKSTLAKAIMKLVNIKSGEIKLKGENITNIKLLKDYRKFYNQVQIIFQNPIYIHSLRFSPIVSSEHGNNSLFLAIPDHQHSVR